MAQRKADVLSRNVAADVEDYEERRMTVTTVITKGRVETMYEYIQTASGWVLYWGAASLYCDEVPCTMILEEGGEAAVGEHAADHEPMIILAV